MLTLHKEMYDKPFCIFILYSFAIVRGATREREGKYKMEDGRSTEEFFYQNSSSNPVSFPQRYINDGK